MIVIHSFNFNSHKLFIVYKIELEGTILNYHSYDDYCQCNDCSYNDDFSRRYSNNFCDCVSNEFKEQRQSCFSRPTRELPPLKPLAKKCTRQEIQDDCIRNVEDDNFVTCDDGKEIVITIKLKN